MFVQKSEKVGVIAARNIQAAPIFNYYGIDFYSRGDRTLEYACVDDNVSMAIILEELTGLADKSGAPDFQTMNLTELSVYILRTHHAFTEKKVVFIRHTLERLAREYTGAGLNIGRIKRLFEELSTYLTVHLKHEEFIVFPFIKKMVKTNNTHFSKIRTIEHPIETMKDDHKHEVALLKELSVLSDNYVCPPNADYALKIALAAMKELEEDLKIHMHLENNILFPRAIDFADAINKHLN